MTAREEGRKRDREGLFEESLDRILSEMESLVSRAVPDRVEPVDADGRFEVTLAGDGLSAYVDLYPPLGKGAPLDWILLVEELERMGIVNILTEGLLRAVEEANLSSRVVRHVLVAQGVPPKPPREARLEILFPLEGETRPSPEEEGPVDYRERSRISSVAPGDVLAVFEPALPGEPGVDVRGQIIPSLPAREVRLRPGNGVVLDEDGRTFRAAETGQPALEGEVLRVDPVYEVRSDVDYGTGNIRFDGSVVVRGSVKEDFRVEAAFDIEVFGNLEAGEILAGRDADVHGGVLGQKALLTAGRDARVRFVEGGRIFADRDVEIVSHALHASVHAGGGILVKGFKGVMGGELEAYDRVDCRSAGSPMGTRTRLVAGSSFRIRADAEALDARIRELQENGGKIAGVIKSILGRYTGGGKTPIPPEVAGKMERLIGLYTQAMGEVKELENRRNALLAQMEAGLRHKGIVKVKGIAFPGTVVEVRGVRRDLVDPLRFFSLRYDPEMGDLSLGPYQ